MKYSVDDLALASLLRIVPRGYRLIDTTDERFTGVRDRFDRLAMRHLGPRPSLVGFTGPGQDPYEAAVLAGRWAAANLRPSAIQRSVNPGVVVVALDPPGGAQAGPVRESPVKAAVWVVRGGRLHSPGRPPGSPPAGLVRSALASLERGEPPPSIGSIDVAERTLMAGRARRRSFTIGSGAGIVVLLLAFMLLRFAPALLSPRGNQRTPGQVACAQGCVSITDADSGRGLAVDPGTEILVSLGASAGSGGGCPTVSDTSVLELVQCGASNTGDGAVAAVFRALKSGQSTISRGEFAVEVTVR